jgi:hypothetical protein
LQLERKHYYKINVGTHFCSFDHCVLCFLVRTLFYCYYYTFCLLNLVGYIFTLKELKVLLSFFLSISVDCIWTLLALLSFLVAQFTKLTSTELLLSIDFSGLVYLFLG